MKDPVKDLTVRVFLHAHEQAGIYLSYGYMLSQKT